MQLLRRSRNSHSSKLKTLPLDASPRGHPVNPRDWNYEALTEEEARLRHPDCKSVEIFSIVDRIR
jgi:hypothetical protein